MSYEAMKRHGGTLNAYDYVKEANLKRLHMVWFPQSHSLWPNLSQAPMNPLPKLGLDFCTSMSVFTLLKFNRNPAKLVWPESCPQPGDAWSCWPAFGKNPLILLGQFSKNTHVYLWRFLLAIFHSLTPILFLGYKYPLFLRVFRVEPSLLPCCQTPM